MAKISKTASKVVRKSKAGNHTLARVKIDSTPDNVKCAHTEIVDIDSLVPHPMNPNKHSDQQIKKKKKIMKHQGWRHPVTVSRRSGFIVAGHGRIMAAQINGWTEVPIDKQDFETESDEYAHLIADNKIAELSEVDLGLVNDLALKLDDGFDLDLLGIPDFVLDGVTTYDLSSQDSESSEEKKYILEVQLPSDEVMVSIFNKLSKQGYLVKVKN